jgi:hypothetical protein
MEKNYNAELDFILEELIKEYENINKGVRFYAEEELLSTNEKINLSVSEKFGLKDWEINVLYYTLLLDKYIKSIDPLTISLEGLVFRNNGGYVQKLIRETKEAQRLEAIQNDFRKYSFGLMIFTAIVAVGTLISAWFFAIEIYRYYVD